MARSILRSTPACFLMAVLAFPVLGARPAATAGSGHHARKKLITQKPKAVGAAGLILIAQRELDANNLANAARDAEEAAAKAPLLDDYAAFIRAQAEYRQRHLDEALRAVKRVFTQTPVSPLSGSAAALATRAALEQDRPKDALELIKKYHARISQPEADSLLGRSLQATGDLAQAAAYYQRVYYGYPTAKEADDAVAALADLKTRLADAYPPPLPASMVERAVKLLDAHNFPAARNEFAAAIQQLGGAQRDLAQVRLGEADFYSHNDRAALDYLSALTVTDPEADAERLNFIVRCARRLDRHADVKARLEELATRHSQSPWRLDTLITVADQAGIDNDLETAFPLYRACTAGFASDPRAGWCHWRLTFASYHKGSEDAYDLLREQIQRFPGSQDVNAALYYLARLLETRNDFAAARTYLDFLIQRFPNTFYAVIARDHVKTPQLASAVQSPDTLAFLQAVAWPGRPEFPSFVPTKMTQRRIDRAQLLASATLEEWAENELKFGARNDGSQENIYAYELAKLATAAGAPDHAIRYIKAFAPNYLYMPLDEAPLAFWRAAFPIPYRYQLEQRCREQGLDPFLVAALIRQESEFNEHVISHANAYGLMQVLPATGKELARRLHVKGFNANQLLAADRNLQLGTFYFRNLLDQFNGRFEPALASYNAGKRRADLWQTWGPFREPAEFIEVVPFHETRGYVQLVLRNADIYRRLYAGTTPEIPPYHERPPAKQRPKRRAPQKHARLAHS